MEGIARLWLITILATAATAIYDYDPTELEIINAHIRELLNSEYKLDNIDAVVEWKLSDQFQKGKKFILQYPNKSWGKNCDERPALSIDGGPKTCLFKMGFRQGKTSRGTNSLQLGLFFLHETNRRDLIIIFSDVFKKPANLVGKLPGVVELEPISREQLVRARKGKSFTGSMSWVKTMMKRGIYNEDLNMDPKAGGKGDSIDNQFNSYLTYPIVIDEETLDEILELQ